MGTDWVRLFNKQLCDQIIALAPANTAAFVESHFSLLHDFSEFKCGFSQDVPASVRLARLLEQGRSDEQLKADLVEHLCVSGDRLAIDYWGCYAEVFSSGDPPGSIPDYKLFPHIEEQTYLLLRPDHVEQMLASLERHRHEIRIMLEPQLAQLREWKTQCSKDSGLMVAYFYDV